MTALLYIVAVLILLAIPTAAWVDAVGKLDDLLTENGDLLFEVDELKAENARLRADVVHVPLLRSVPAQRDGSEYEWPQIARVLNIEGEVSP